jgi:hypothetical protein
MITMWPQRPSLSARDDSTLAPGHHWRMRHFVDDDAGYQQWLGDHPSDFVINTGRNPTAAYLMLHRADCKTISGRPATGSTFTGDYTKVCGGREELEAFAGELGGAASPCGLCLGRPAFGAQTGGRYGPCVTTSQAAVTAWRG